jgi:preprotein translocase subunit SecA
MFEELGAIIRDEVVRHLFHVEVQPEEAQQLQPAASPDSERLSYEHEALAGADAIAAAGGNGSGNGGGAAFTAGTVGAGATSVATGQRTVSAEQKVGRNDPCWCGSGKKFKKCHGA